MHQCSQEIGKVQISTTGRHWQSIRIKEAFEISSSGNNFSKLIKIAPTVANAGLVIGTMPNIDILASKFLKQSNNIKTYKKNPRFYMKTKKWNYRINKIQETHLVLFAKWESGNINFHQNVVRTSSLQWNLMSNINKLFIKKLAISNDHMLEVCSFGAENIWLIVLGSEEQR